MLVGGRRLKVTFIDTLTDCRSNQDSQAPLARIRLRIRSDAQTAHSWIPDSGSRLRARSPRDSPACRSPSWPPLDAWQRSTIRVRCEAFPGTVPPLKSQQRLCPAAAIGRPWRPAAGQPGGLAGAPLGAGAVALRPASGRVNSVARRRTWPEPQLLKLAIARGRRRSCGGRVTQAGGVRHRSAPSLGSVLTWGSLRRRTPRSALAYTAKRALDAGASGAGVGPAPLDLQPVQSNGIGVPSSWGVCSGQKDASFVGMGGRVRAVRARGARRPGTSRAFRGISRSCPGALARRRAVRASAPGTRSLFHGALDRAPHCGAPFGHRKPSSHEDRSHQQCRLRWVTRPGGWPVRRTKGRTTRTRTPEP